MGINTRFNNSLAHWNNPTPAFVSYKQNQLTLKHAFDKLLGLVFLSPPACLVIVCMLFLWNKPALTSQPLWKAGQAEENGDCSTEYSSATDIL